jgi:hypothetical protein
LYREFFQQLDYGNMRDFLFGEEWFGLGNKGLDREKRGFCKV